MRVPSLAAGLLTLAATIPGIALGADVSVVGLFTNKAVVVVGNAAPKTYAVGSMVADGVRLVAVDGTGAVFETNGKRQSIAIGEYISQRPANGPASVTLKADERGHYLARGQINGGQVQMLVDTGATMIALPASDARRLGIDYRRGQPSVLNTANGMVPAYLVRLDTVKVGDIVLNQVDAVVQEQGLPVILLGMSFLNRMAMRREGDTLTLMKRY
jgi:aspartyl protease family protein